MYLTPPSGLRRTKPSLAAFTLMELLAVIAIIAILTALVLWASQGVRTMASRSRAKTEIQAMGTALDGYKTDNGAFPLGNGMGTPADYPLDPSVIGGNYQISSQLLYLSLSGQSSFTAPPTDNVKSYMTFTKTQIGNPGGVSYVQDPWGYSYGYSTGDETKANPPNNGVGFFDLWSTGGTTGVTTAIPNPKNSWIVNWPQ